MTTTPSELVALRKLCHEVATQGPKNWRAGLLNELAAALAASGEAVVWQLRVLHTHKGRPEKDHWSNWIDISQEQYERAKKSGKWYEYSVIELRPLYAAPQPAHRNSSASVELSMLETLVPCDCGCGRQCCAHCGVDLGFIAEAGG